MQKVKKHFKVDVADLVYTAMPFSFCTQTQGDKTFPKKRSTLINWSYKVACNQNEISNERNHIFCEANDI